MELQGALVIDVSDTVTKHHHAMHVHMHDRCFNSRPQGVVEGLWTDKQCIRSHGYEGNVCASDLR